MRVERVVYGVSNLEECVRFFTDFGLDPLDGGGTGARFATQTGQVVELRDAGDSSLPPAVQDGPSLREIVWGVDTQESLDKLATGLLADRSIYTDADGVAHTTDETGFGVGGPSSERRGTSMRVVDIVIGVGWVIFWVGWFAASAGAKRGQRGRGNWARFAGVRVALILVVVLLVRLRVLKGHGVGYVTDPVLWGVGLAIWVLGLGLAVWARIYLGRNWGMPTSTKEDPELVTSGPYRTIRHPIYTGILLAMIGSAIAVSVWWLIAVALIGGYFIYSAFVEERNMTRLFPSAYPEYQQSTKMLIPFIF